MPTNTLSSESSVSQVRVYPDFVLNERWYAENHVQYDPDTGVLAVLRDRLTQPEDVQVVLPAEVEGSEVSVEFDDGSQVIAREGAVTLPQVAMFGELACTIAFAPAPTGGVKPPPVKVKISIRVRPTGGG